MSTPNNADHDSPTNPTPVSRRGFLKRLSQMGAALGLGVTALAATSKTAHACTPPEDEYKYEYGVCGNCNLPNERGRIRRRYRRACRVCNGGVLSCTAWTLVGTTCVTCP